MTQPAKENKSSPKLERSAAGGHSPWLVAVIVSMATFMEVLDTSIANVALPHIAGGLASSQEESTWVLTSYLVSNAIILPISGWLATVIGRKRFYMICVAIFGISSFLCGIAPSLGWLIVFRVLQGLGGGGLAPSEQSILADSFPPEQRGSAFALYGIAVVVAPTIGPMLGGWITDNFSWHWIFLINIPVCVFSLLLCGWILSDPPAVEQDRREALKNGLQMDFLGFFLVALGLGCLQFVLDKGQEDDWFHSEFVLIFAIISALSLIFLVIWECLQEDPIVDLPLFKRKSFAISALMMFATGFVMLSTTQMLPQFLQTIMGYNATKAGLTLTAGGIATMCMMPVCGALLQRVQPKYLIMIGLLIQSIACYHLCGFNTQISFGHAAWARVLQAIGLPFLFVPITTISYDGLPPGKSNNASALINSMRNLGASFGISFGVTLLARRQQFHHERLAESITPFAQSRGAHPFHSVPMLDHLIQQQAAMLSYIEIFWILSLILLGLVPVALLLHKAKRGQTAAH